MVDEPQQDINDPKNNDEVEAKPKSKPKEKAAEKGKDGKRKIQSFKGFDAGKYIDIEPTLNEMASSKPAVITFGRMNPITMGHEKLANAVASQAKNSGGVGYIYLSQSQDKNKNPLSYNDKIKYAQKAFGKIVIKSKARTIIEVMAELSGKHKDVIVVVGSDRVKEFDRLLNKYNKSSAGYVFNNITVVSAGQRDPDAEGVKGMSGTKMRGFAMDNDVKKFATGLPSKLKTSAAAILADVRKGMNMSEDNDNEFENIEDFVEDTAELDEVLDRMQRRAIGIRMRKNRFKMKRGREKAARRTATMQVLKKRARKQAIRNLKDRFAKNKRYADMSSGEKIVIDKRVAKFSKQRLDAMARKLLPKVKVKERERKRAANKSKNESLNIQFENFVAEAHNPTHVKMAVGIAADKKYGNNMSGAVKTINKIAKGLSDHPQVAAVLKRKNEDADTQFENFMAEKTGKYYTGVAKNKRDDREDHFERNAKKADDDASAYKPAPGDKEAKTKESKHTKKAREMGFTEELEENHIWGQRQGKRPHMLLDKNGKTKFDKRFKMYKPKLDEATDLIGEDIVDLMKSTESYIQEDSADKSLAKKSEKSGMPQGVLKQVYNRGVAAWKTGHRPGTTPEQWGHARVNSFITKSSGTWGKADKDLAAKVRKEEVELEENYKITKMYNPTTKKSRTAGKSTSTFAVHTHDRKYFKEFPTQKDAENHMKTLGKNEAFQDGKTHTISKVYNHKDPYGGKTIQHHHWSGEWDERKPLYKVHKKGLTMSDEHAKDFKTKEDAEKHLKSVNKDIDVVGHWRGNVPPGKNINDYKKNKSEAKINELDKDTLANYANKAIRDKEDAKYNFNRAVGSKAANRMRGNVQGASDDVKKIKSHSDRIKRRERGAAHFTRKMLRKKKED